MAASKAKKRATKSKVKTANRVVVDSPPDSYEEPLDDFDPSTIVAPPINPRYAAMEKLASKFSAWRPAREVLRKVFAVPTCFAQYDRATRVGGHPIERFTLIHGPSNHGKTMWCHGLGMSFLKRGHFYLYVDAEMTTPITWLENTMTQYADHPGFLAMRPKTYEETVDAVRVFCNGLASARQAGEIDPATSALIVVDSIKKLVPSALLAKILKGDGGIDGMGGRGAQIKAAMNAAWLDELTPLLYHTRCTMVAIAREAEDPTADAMDKKFGNDWKVGGGSALVYDSSLVNRITRAGWVRESTDPNARVFGERHCITIRKTKIAGKDEKVVKCYFHTSNGVLIPEGFDPARDLFEMAKQYGIIVTAGSWFTFGRTRWQGENNVVKALSSKPELMEELDLLVRARFSPDEDIPDDTQTPEVEA